MVTTESPVTPGIESNPEPDLDEDILAEVMRGLDTSSRHEAINAALTALAEAKREVRRQAREELRRMSDEGAFDYAALDEVDR